VLFVCGGVNPANRWSPQLAKALQSVDKRGGALGSLCTGAYQLAKSGLLDNVRCTIHWENLVSSREEFPKAVLTNDIYEIDQNRYTCAGGTTSIDLMLELIRRTHGKELVAAISEEAVIDRIRTKDDQQRIPLRQQIGTSQPKLTEAVKLMEANLEEPISPDELAGYVGISRRQLERLFRTYLDCTPSRYYLELRLRNARMLLLQTENSIVEISLMCGFISTPHFSKCYREMFGLPPRDERRRLLKGASSAVDS
jgi:transcriptional regulator GlxA family with amidase domain